MVSVDDSRLQADSQPLGAVLRGPDEVDELLQ